VPTDAVAGFCLGTAACAAVFHVAFETTQWPQTTGQWLAVAALGVAPVGAAFYAWDIGVKRGDIRILGVGSYLAPLLSTLFLVLAGYASASWSLALAAALVAGGGILAAKDMIARKEHAAEPGPGGDVQQIGKTLDAVIAWAASRPDILGVALIGSWARGEATASSDVDLMFIAVAPDAFRENDWPSQIAWAAPLCVTGSRDATYGVVWSRHLRLSSGPEIEFSFADRSWVATNPVAPSTVDVVRGGWRILVDKQRLLERLQAAARR
jgi:hypothetical protein